MTYLAVADSDQLTDTSVVESEWRNWSDERPTDSKALYWWRVGPRKIGGMELRPEWTDTMRLCGMGYAENEYWPPFSNWNGYQRSVPGDTQWRLAAPDEKNQERWGLNLSGCPFCGAIPTLKWVRGAPDGGVFVSSRPYQANRFWLEQRGCVFGSTHHYNDLPGLLAMWTRRTTESNLVSSPDKANLK